MTSADAPAFIVIDLPITVGRSESVTLRLPDPTVSRRHATLTRAGVDLAVEDHDARFGTFVNGARVRSATLRPGDRVRFGSTVTYRVEPGGLRLEFDAVGVALEVVELAISGRSDPGFDLLRRVRLFRRTGPGEGSVERPGSGLLVEGVGFRVRPDSFVGILGPSGAGKSTLLNCLAGYRPPDRGRVTFDAGRDARGESDAYRATLGHVPQNDVVYPSLTARENLAFAARLRLGGAGAAEVAAAIAGALERVTLAGHADKPVSVLSGGQRKRLGVAIELLRRPRLLLLDEPTSGLDPASEAHLMEQLRHLARRGTTVVCTTHLMDNLGLLDEVVALGVVEGIGRLAYSGPPCGLLAHFGCRGFADLYEALASGRFEPVYAKPEARPAADEAPADPRSTRTPSGLGPIGPESDGDISYPGLPTGIGRRPVSPPADAGWGQLALVSRRALRLVFRDRGLVAAMTAQPVVLGILAVVSQYDADKPFSILFFAVVIATWLGLNNAARDLVRERRHYVRDRLAGLGPAAYLGAKATVHATIGFAQVLILLVVLRVGCGLVLRERTAGDLAAVNPIRWSSMLMLSYIGGVGLGLLASTLARTEEAAVAALPLLIMPQLLISAVAAGVQNEPYTRPRPFRPLVVSILGGLDPSRPAIAIDLLSMVCPSRPAALVAEAPGVKGYGRWIWVGDLCHLLVLVLGTWALVFLAFQLAERRWLRLDVP